MTTSSSHIEVRGIPVEIVRKDIKNLHLAVYPPLGRVRIAVPLQINNEAARLAVVSNLGWIKRRQDKYQAQERQAIREFVSGESHYFMGNRYRMRVQESSTLPCVKIRNKAYIDMFVPKGWSREEREKLMHQWYRRELRKILPSLIKKWEMVMHLKISDLRIKRMKTMWGSCNPLAKRIWVNLELAKKPQICLEYIIVHEMAHFLERTHNEKFANLMDMHMPQWRNIRAELNEAPLSYESWTF